MTLLDTGCERPHFRLEAGALLGRSEDLLAKSVNWDFPAKQRDKHMNQKANDKVTKHHGLECHIDRATNGTSDASQCPNFFACRWQKRTTDVHRHRQQEHYTWKRAGSL